MHRHYFKSIFVFSLCFFRNFFLFQILFKIVIKITVDMHCRRLTHLNNVMIMDLKTFSAHINEFVEFSLLLPFAVTYLFFIVSVSEINGTSSTGAMMWIGWKNSMHSWKMKKCHATCCTADVKHWMCLCRIDFIYIWLDV